MAMRVPSRGPRRSMAAVIASTKPAEKAIFAASRTT
jgi:hypothetical protein